ncbi:MAG: glycosyltransferase family 39 protein, partial [Desulfobacterales bacterium]|nr:glycosyltransferase family 39 protein [Desulfobacterales bacterium]
MSSDRPTGLNRVEPRHEWLWLLGAVVVMGVVYAVLASGTTLWDRDEPRFSRAAVEMLMRGDYVVPWFNGEWRLHKPIMVYWFMAGSMKVLGQTELALRLPSILGMIVTALCTYGVGRRMFGVRAARWAFVVLATAVLPIYMGQAATADGVLNGFIALALLAMVEAVYRGGRWWAWPGVAVGLAGAMLTKGPVGLGVVWLSA